MNVRMSRPLPVRVCMVSGAYPPAPCGVGDYTSHLARELAARGVEVAIVTSSYLGIPSHKNNPEVRPAVRGWSLLHGAQVAASILRTRSDVYHFQMPSQEYRYRLFPFLSVVLTKMLARPARVVVTLHELPVANFRRPLRALTRKLRIWLCLVGADGVVVVDESYGKELCRLYRRARKISRTFIPIASNIPRSRMNAHQLAQLRARLAGGAGAVLMAYFGFINPPKGFEDMLGVLARLKERGVNVNLIVLASLSENDRYHATLIKRISEAGLDAHVKVLGFLDGPSVADHLAAADVCALPFREGVQAKNGSFLAALAQDVFIVTTSRRQRGLDEKGNVYYAVPGDVAGMADAVQRYAGRRTPPPAVSEHGWPAIAEQHVSFYNNLLARSPEREADACSSVRT